MVAVKEMRINLKLKMIATKDAVKMEESTQLLHQVYASHHNRKL